MWRHSHRRRCCGGWGRNKRRQAWSRSRSHTRGDNDWFGVILAAQMILNKLINRVADVVADDKLYKR